MRMFRTWVSRILSSPMKKLRRQEEVVHFLKAAAVVVTSFIGAAFSIMTFNNDVDTTKLFGQIYELITGSASDGLQFWSLLTAWD